MMPCVVESAARHFNGIGFVLAACFTGSDHAEFRRAANDERGGIFDEARDCFAGGAAACQECGGAIDIIQQDMCYVRPV